jgi:hypothetical protein
VERIEWGDVAGGVLRGDRAPQGSLMAEGRGTGWSLEMMDRSMTHAGVRLLKLTTKHVRPSLVFATHIDKLVIRFFLVHSASRCLVLAADIETITLSPAHASSRRGEGRQHLELTCIIFAGNVIAGTDPSFSISSIFTSDHLACNLS